MGLLAGINLATTQRKRPGLKRSTNAAIIMPENARPIMVIAVVFTWFEAKSCRPTGTEINKRVPNTKKPISFSTTITDMERAILPV